MTDPTEGENHDTQWMLEGIAALEAGNFSIALERFERVLAVREARRWRDEPELAWSLAAAHLNRSDALRGVGGEGSAAEALASIDRAIEAMRHVPLANHPALPERLILARIHRATLCGEAGRGDPAAEAFAEAEALLDRWGRELTSERVFLDAMLHANRARHRTEESPAAACEDARRAVERLRTLPETPVVAGAKVRAGAILCRALARMLGEPERVGDWIAVATDAAEEALAVVRRHQLREPLAADLVRYGALIYRKCQPHFLGEYLCDWLAGDGPLAGDEALKDEMRNELLAARLDVERRVLVAPHETAFVEKQARILDKLREAESALLSEAGPT